jgi:Rrf2 family protein
MQITRQADYALRAMLFLSRLPANQRASTSSIAHKMNIPPSFLAKIISQLSIAGLIHTSRGAHGGVTPARPPEEITFLEVVEAIDGPIALNGCILNPSICQFEPECPLHVIWCETQVDLVAKLRGITFSQINKEPIPA